MLSTAIAKLERLPVECETFAALHRQWSKDQPTVADGYEKNKIIITTVGV